LADDIGSGIELAAGVLDSGRAADALAALVRTSQSAAEEASVTR
jgi:anthranilate phosphoribosyltransferase